MPFFCNVTPLELDRTGPEKDQTAVLVTVFDI